MKVALIHDHLAQNGGAERILRYFQEIFPEAPTYTLVYKKEATGGIFDKRKIRTSFIQKLPFGVRHYRWYLSLMPAAVEKYDLKDFEVVLSSSSSFAKGVIVGPKTLHICYCHTPTRFLWSDTHQYLADLSYNKYIKNLISLLLPRLRVWDQLSAQRVDQFIANSENVRKRIKKYYRRESTIIYPPVEIEKFKIAQKTDKYFLTGGRLVAYKRFDLVVKAFNALGIPLKIFGDGPEEKKLRKIAKSNIQFLGIISEEKKRELFSESRAFINPQEEDFGITILESLASGRPVIALNQGGALEIIEEGKNGHFFEEQSWEAIADKVVRFKPERFDPVKIRETVMKFNVSNFKEQMKSFIEKSWQEFKDKYY